MRNADHLENACTLQFGLLDWRRMLFGISNAGATFQRAFARALLKKVKRQGSIVLSYIDDIVIATETAEDHLERIREVFDCLHEDGFKVRVSKSDFMKTEIHCFGRVVSTKMIKPNPKAVGKLRDWEVLRQDGCSS